MSNYTNNRSLTPNAQMLRKNMTKEEKKLWYDFFKLLDVTVNRQKVIDKYIVDFCIPSAHIIIELDGSQHYEPESKEYDIIRDAHLTSLGYTVVRYTNAVINKNFDGVCADILKRIRSANITCNTRVKRY